MFSKKNETFLIFLNPNNKWEKKENEKQKKTSIYIYNTWTRPSKVIQN